MTNRIVVAEKPWPTSVFISPLSRQSLGASIRGQGGGTWASAVWPSANLAEYVPFTIEVASVAVKLFVCNGATVSGNIDVGIYRVADLARVVSSGSTAQAGTNTMQEFDIADTLLQPGQYYIGTAMNNVTGTVIRSNLSVVAAKFMGIAEQAAAFALPATAVPVAKTVAGIAMTGLSLRTQVA